MIVPRLAATTTADQCTHTKEKRTQKERKDIREDKAYIRKCSTRKLNSLPKLQRCYPANAIFLISFAKSQLSSIRIFVF